MSAEELKKKIANNVVWLRFIVAFPLYLIVTFGLLIANFISGIEIDIL